MVVHTSDTQVITVAVAANGSTILSAYPRINPPIRGGIPGAYAKKELGADVANLNFGCGRPECHASTGICERITFGTGKLDEYGYWEHGCDKCARAWEKLYGEKAWPPSSEIDPEESEKTIQRFIEFNKGKKCR